MIFRILHLSDLHIQKGSTTKFDLNKISNAISTLPSANTYAVALSGDISYSGIKEEYEEASSFFIKMFKENIFIRDDNIIKFLYAPGNHDINYSIQQVQDAITKHQNSFGKFPAIHDSQISTIQNSYYTAMKEFYHFSKLGHCEWHDKFICKRKFSFGNKIINFVLVNSAPFSLLCGPSSDKGAHMLTKEQLETIRNAADGYINILVMHHSLEWFHDEIKKELRDILAQKYLIFLFGHEHDEIAESRNINLSGECFYFQANALNDPSLTNNGFGVVDIDFSSKDIKAYSFEYEKNMYTHHIVNTLTLHKNCNDGIVLLESYKQFLKLDTSGKPYDNYYCFPGLEYTTFSDKQKLIQHEIKSEEELVSLILTCKKVTITGERKTGKSLIAKKLYRELFNAGKIVLLFNKSINHHKKERIIEYMFKEQYKSDNNDFELFCQLQKSKKVAIIDDADLIKHNSLNALIQTLNEQFGTVVIITKEEISTDIKKEVQEYIDNEIKLVISPFWFSSRKELVKNVLKSINFDEEQIEAQANTINELINIQIKYFSLTPEFIIDFVNHYINDSKFQFSSGKEAFSIVYENSLRNRIIRHAENIPPEKILYILQELAYIMHFAKKSEISHKEVLDCIQNYYDDYRQEVKITSFIDVCISANILVENSFNTYSFIDSSHIAYFVAKALNQKASLKSTDSEYTVAQKKFTEVLDALCFGINSDIVLFLSLITNNMNFVQIIIDKAKEHFMSMEELNFNVNNLPLISDVNFSFEDKAPTSEDKKRYNATLTESEKIVKESDRFEIVDEYDYTEQDLKTFSNQSLISLKYLEILSKTLPAFCMGMKRDQQDELVELLYKSPNQFLYMILKDIDAEFDEFINFLYKDAKNKGKNITKNKLISFTKQFTALFTIMIYRSVSTTCTSSESLQALNEFKELKSSSNYKLLNLMINSKTNDVKTFKNSAISLEKKCNLPIEKTIVKFIVWNFYLINDVSLHGDGEALAEYFFGKEKKQLEIKKSRKKVLNKEKS